MLKRTYLPWFISKLFQKMGNKKTVLVAIGAGYRLETACIAITLHIQMGEYTIGITYVVRPAGPAGCNAVIHVIDGFHGEASSIAKEVVPWRTQSTQWFFPEHALACDIEIATGVLTGMMAVGAYPGQHQTFGYIAESSEVPTLYALRDAGLVEGDTATTGHVRWCLTQHGSANISMSRMRLEEPRPFFSR